MEGYSKQRFVNLSTYEDEELTCGICFGILNKPVVLRCCQQMFCNGCINEWLNTNEKCPNDRSRLTSYDLCQPPRLVLNMISKLYIHCDYEKNGCQKIVKMDELANHVASCKFDCSICSNCGYKFTIDENHDCILNLKKLNMSLNDEITMLREENNKYHDRNNMNITLHVYNTLSSARDFINSNLGPNVLDKRCIDSGLLGQIIYILMQTIQSFSSLEQISMNICRNLNAIDPNHIWHVFVYTNECGSSYVITEKHYLKVSFGSMKLEIFTYGKKKKLGLSKLRI